MQTQRRAKEPQRDVAFESIYLRMLGPGWVELERGIFVQRVGDLARPPHAA
jgi:hypothetical protein